VKIRLICGNQEGNLRLNHLQWSGSVDVPWLLHIFLSERLNEVIDKPKPPKILKNFLFTRRIDMFQKKR